MPVREGDRRRLERQELQAQLDQWDKDLKDQEWIELLKEYKPFKKFCSLLKSHSDATIPALESLKKQLFELPMGTEKMVELREKVMLGERDRQVMENLLTFPDREVVRLSEIQKQIPDLKQQIKQLDRELDK